MHVTNPLLVDVAEEIQAIDTSQLVEQCLWGGATAQDGHTRSSNGLSMLCLTFTAPCYILKRNGGGLPPPPSPPRVHTHQNLIQAGIREFPGEHLYLVERGAEASLLPWRWMRGGHLMGGISNTHTAAAGTQAMSLMPMAPLHCHSASHVIPLSLHTPCHSLVTHTLCCSHALISLSVNYLNVFLRHFHQLSHQP